MFVALDLRPRYAVKGEGFKYLMKTINRGWVPFSRETVGKKIKEIVDRRRSMIASHLQGQSSFCLNYDGWRDDIDRDWLGSTVHWIDLEFNLQYCILDIQPLPEKQTAENMVASIESSLERNGLQIENITAVTIDNAANMVAAVRQLRFDQDPVSRVPCVAHTLNLIVQKSILGFAKDENDPRLLLEEDDDLDFQDQIENVSDGEHRLTRKLLKLITY